MKPGLFLALAAGVALVSVHAGRSTLDIYFVDVEGGQATLIVTPSGESLLIDAGFPGTGTFRSKPGDPADARDAPRVAAAARDAGLSKIDYMLTTHFHADHDGGIPELAQLLPIDTFIDHNDVRPEAETTVGGTLEAFDAYAAVRAAGRHIEARPGRRLPLKDLDVTVVASGGSTIARPLTGAGGRNRACGASGLPAAEPNENPRSTGVLVRFGRFRLLDLGDLTGAPLFDLVCPRDLVGPVDVYLVTHHGNADAADPATFAAFRPRVAVVNNGKRKGGAAETLASIRQSPGLEDAWQLHWSDSASDGNLPADRIANLDEQTSHWIKLGAHDDGSFDMTNGRTGMVKRYLRR